MRREDKVSVLEQMRNNRSYSIPVAAAALTAALMLSFLCSIFYCFWAGEVANIVEEEGDWQGRITGTLTEEDLAVIRSFGNVKSAVVSAGSEPSGRTGEITVDILLYHPRRIYGDMPLLADKLGLTTQAISYHTLLLSRYLIHDPADKEPPRLLTVYLVILMLAALSLVLIIHNAFGVSMQAKVRQLGILSGIGATPRQIRVYLMKEAAALCIAPAAVGYAAGVGLGAAVVSAMKRMAERVTGAYAMDFTLPPAVAAADAALIVLTVACSAWIPARKLSRLTPLEAVRNAGEPHPGQGNFRSPVLAKLFGIEGELAGSALKAQKKSLRMSSLSLTLSFLGFTLMLCLFTLSQISTRHTYFERYQEAWDVMATIGGTKLADFAAAPELEACRSLAGADNVAAYQKATAAGLIPAEGISEELEAVSGEVEAFSEEPEEISEEVEAVSEEPEAPDSPETAAGMRKVHTSLIVLDDETFLAYCESAGITPGLDGAVILNQVWDSVNSSFRYKSYIPFLKETQEAIYLQSADEQFPDSVSEGQREAEGGKGVAIPILGYTREALLLREEYEDNALVQFVPLSLWKTIEEAIGGAEDDMYIRILAKDRENPAALDKLEEQVTRLLAGWQEAEVENRISEKENNDDLIAGYQIILGGLCGILALAGIANVWAYTMGFLRQRRREFARYLSIGMTPDGLCRMFAVEAFVIAGRPLLITLPLTTLIVAYMIKASYLNPMEFVAEAPWLPVLGFYMIIVLCVALAYGVSVSRILRHPLTETLRDDTMI